MADRHRDRRGVGRVRHQLLRHDRQAPRAAPLRRDLVLHREHRHGRGPAHLQQPLDSRRPLKSYSIYAGVQDAFMQWWYGHNAVAFFLTTPFLGLMYYFLPKAAERPVYSYKLSILHFWSLVFMYIWAGPHHLHYTALPEWASTLGMLFSRDAVDAVVGRHDQRPAHAARRMAQGRRRAGAQVLRRRHHGVRHGDVRRADALDEERERARALHRLDHRPRAHGRARLERLPDVRHDLLAAAAALPDAALQQEARGSAFLGGDASASCSTSSRSTPPA